MGADLIGYIIKGPLAIAEDSAEAVIAFLKKQSIAVAPFLLVCQRTGDIPPGLQECEFFCEDHIDDPGSAYDVGVHLEALVFDDDDPTEWVDSFVTMWNNGDGRDFACRIDPDDRTRKIAFVGEMSWGDTPDGYSYAHIHRAFLLGVYEMLGLR